jgi:hypothetical protein
MIGMADDKETTIYDAVSGGAELVRWFGQVPSFHDAEILSLYLRRKGGSVLCLHGWTNTGTVGRDGYYVLDRHAIVTFTLYDVMDLQNVIGSLVLRRAPDRPERRGYFLDPLPQDIEIELGALLWAQRPDPGALSFHRVRAGQAQRSRRVRNRQYTRRIDVR